MPSCVGSGLFKAFSEHTLHRLGVTQDHHSVSLFHYKSSLSHEPTGKASLFPFVLVFLQTSVDVQMLLPREYMDHLFMFQQEEYRITLLSRSTQYRRILNQDEVILLSLMLLYCYHEFISVASKL